MHSDVGSIKEAAHLATGNYKLLSHWAAYGFDTLRSIDVSKSSVQIVGHI